MAIPDTEAIEARRAAEIAFVRAAAQEPLPPPITARGAIGWLRANLFSTPTNIALTILCVLLIVWVVPPFLRFMLIDAVWTGADRQACLPTPERPEVGACWAFVAERLNFFIYGFYPVAERWRVDIFFAMLACGIVWLLWLRAPRRDIGAFYFFVVLPVASYILLRGWPAIGLRESTPHYGAAFSSPLWFRRSALSYRCRSAFCSRSGGARACPRYGCSR